MRRWAPSLLLVGLLAACSGAPQASGPTGDTDAPAPRFGPVERSPDRSDPEGLGFVLRVQSNTEASWADAMSAYTDEGKHCAHGANYVILDMQPADPTMARDPAARRYPAGTVFEQRLRCEVPFPQEVVVPTEMADAAVMARLDEALGARQGPGQPRIVVRYSDRNPKYSALHKALGYVLADGLRGCRDSGVAVRQIAVFAKPQPQGQGPNEAKAFLGAALACGDGQPPDPVR